MQRFTTISATSLFLFIALISTSQSTDFIDFTRATPYRAGAAILIDGKICDKNYFVEGQPRLAQGMTGTITIASVTASCGGGIPINNISFQVAIKNELTNTIWVYTKENVSEVKLEDILKKCSPGDRIIFMPVNQKYALPKHEMAVASGC